MEAFIQLTRIETRIILRSKVAVFWTFAFPILLMIGQAKLSGSHSASLPRVIAGVVSVIIVSTALMGFAVPLVQGREMGTLAGCSAWPLSKLRLIGAMAVARLQIIGLAVGLVMLIACSMLHADLSGSGFAFAMILILGSVALLTFGAAVGGRIQQMQTAMALCNLLYFGMLFLGSVFFDPKSLPTVLAETLAWLPVNALVQGLILSMQGNLQALWQPVAALTIFLVASAFIIDRKFDWSLTRHPNKSAAVRTQPS